MGWLAMNYPQHYKYPRVIALSLSLLAVGIGYSRMYLAQHSLIDVCAGGTLALLILSLASILGKKWELHE
jgi:membrane-associated phospholipid phosphatase